MMADSAHCSNCGAPVRPDDAICGRCGEVLDAPRVPAAVEEFDWRDGNGVDWRLESRRDRLELISAAQRFAIPRDLVKNAVSRSSVGSGEVIRIDTGDREVGFMVSPEESRRFAAALGIEAPPDSQPVVPDDEIAVARPASQSSTVGQGPLWPKMTAGPVVALSLSVLTFIPYIGAAFAIAAYLLALRAIRAAGDRLAFLHVRVMSRLSVGFTTAGVLICALAIYAMARTGSTEAISDQLVGDEFKWTYGAGAAAIVMVLIALSIHEAAHAITAWWCGDDYARSQGRVTLNPLAHIDLFGTVILPIILVATHGPIFGYARPVPVRLGMVPHYRRSQILVAAAGPGSNLIQAAICLGLLILIGILLGFAPSEVRRTVANFSTISPAVSIKGFAGAGVVTAAALMLKLGFFVNVFLAFFNLIPIPPLDGSWILEHLLPDTFGRIIAAIRPFGILLFLGLIWWGNALDTLLTPAIYVTGYGLRLVGAVTGF